MKINTNSRMKFLKRSVLSGIGIGLASGMRSTIFAGYVKNTDTPAILGVKS